MEAGYHLTRVDGCPLLFVFLVKPEALRTLEKPKVPRCQPRLISHALFLLSTGPFAPQAHCAAPRWRSRS